MYCNADDDDGGGDGDDVNVDNDANSDGTSPNDSSKVVSLSRQFQKKKK